MADELKFTSARHYNESIKVDTSELYFFSGVLRGMGRYAEAGIVYALTYASRPDMTMEGIVAVADEVAAQWEKEARNG